MQYASIGGSLHCGIVHKKIDSIAALLYYDYCLTFPGEVKYIWSRKFTITTILYVCCRYALLANLLYLFAISNVINKVSLSVSFKGG